MSQVTMMQARDLFKDRRPFTASSCYARRLAHGYAVFSYGEHFPLFVYSNVSQSWFMNCDRYSATTARHRSHFKRVLVERGDGIHEESTNGVMLALDRLSEQ